jgi:hypothetical protein
MGEINFATGEARDENGDVVEVPRALLLAPDPATVQMLGTGECLVCEDGHWRPATAEEAAAGKAFAAAHSSTPIYLVAAKAPTASPVVTMTEYRRDGAFWRRYADGTLTGPHAEAAMGRAWSMNRVLSCLRHGGAASIRDALVAEGAPEDGAVGAAEAAGRPARDDVEYDAGPGRVLFTSHLRDMADALNRATVFTPERYPGGRPCGELRPSVGVTCALPFDHPGTHLSLLQDGTWLHFVGQDAPHVHHAGAAGVFAADPCGEPYTGDMGPKCWGRCGKARGHGGQHRVEAKRDGGRSVWEWGPDGESFEDGAFESARREVERQAQRERDGWVGSKPLTTKPVAGMVEYRRDGAFWRRHPDGTETGPHAESVAGAERHDGAPGVFVADDAAKSPGDFLRNLRVQAASFERNGWVTFGAFAPKADLGILKLNAVADGPAPAGVDPKALTCDACGARPRPESFNPALCILGGWRCDCGAVVRMPADHEDGAPEPRQHRPQWDITPACPIVPRCPGCPPGEWCRLCLAQPMRCPREPEVTEENDETCASCGMAHDNTCVGPLLPDGPSPVVRVEPKDREFVMFSIVAPHPDAHPMGLLESTSDYTHGQPEAERRQREAIRAELDRPSRRRPRAGRPTSWRCGATSSGSVTGRGSPKRSGSTFRAMRRGGGWRRGRAGSWCGSNKTHLLPRCPSSLARRRVSLGNSLAGVRKRTGGRRWRSVVLAGSLERTRQIGIPTSLSRLAVGPPKRRKPRFERGDRVSSPAWGGCLGRGWRWRCWRRGAGRKCLS